MATFIRERRTGDRVGGAHMRALRVPGANDDILLDWMIKEGTLHSRIEHTRHEQVNGQKKSQKGNGKEKGGKSKGKKKGGTPGKGGASSPQA